MRVDTIPRIYTGSFNWDKSVGQNIVTLLDNDPSLIRQAEPNLPQDFICNCFLEELYTIERFPSLPQTSLPDWSDKDSRRERTLKTYEMQWKTKNLHCNLFITKKVTASTLNDWTFLGTIPFLNTEGFKYTRHSAFDLLTNKLVRGFGERAKLGIQIEQASEYPFADIDKLSIDYTWRQEAILIQPDYTPVYIGAAQVTDITAYSELITSSLGMVARQVAPAREKRISLQMTNNGNSTFYYSQGATVSATNNDGIIAPSSTREILNYNGVVAMVSSATAVSGNLTTRERYQAT